MTRKEGMYSSVEKEGKTRRDDGGGKTRFPKRQDKRKGLRDATID